MENEFDNEYNNSTGRQDNYGGASPRPDNAEENTTYHYSYTNHNQKNENSTNYYSAPAQEPNAGSEPARSNKKAKTVEYDEFGNPIKPKKNKAALTIVLVIVICAVLAVIGLFVSMNSNTDTEKNTEKESTSSAEQVETKEQDEVAKKDNTGNFTVAGIAESCIDSCVGITVYTEASSYSDFYNYGFGQGQQSNGGQTKSGEGSGIIMLESNGKTYILTCAHVISDASKFTVTLNNGDEYDASMVGYDSQTDIGVLSINATGLKVAEFADSDSTVLGEQVVAIGCPGGLEFMNSVTSGYVSALARPISSTIGYDTDCIQIDAAINPGNSGGALFNMQGQIIGVNSSKIAATEYEGIGFAVPSNTAIATANSIIKVGYVEGRAKIGITYKSIQNYSNSESIINALAKLGFEDANGTMVINEVSSDSDLAGKNIHEYDMIVAVNGETLTDTDVMTSVLADSKPGDTVKLTIARIENNEINTFEVDCKLIESKGNN